MNGQQFKDLIGFKLSELLNESKNLEIALLDPENSKRATEVRIHQATSCTEFVEYVYQCALEVNAKNTFSQALKLNTELLIAECDLPPTVKTNLSKQGIYTVSELITYSERDLLITPNIGKKSLKLITTMLGGLGLELADSSRYYTEIKKKNDS